MWAGHPNAFVQHGVTIVTPKLKHRRVIAMSSLFQEEIESIDGDFFAETTLTSPKRDELNIAMPLVFIGCGWRKGRLAPDGRACRRKHDGKEGLTDDGPHY